MRGYFCTYCEKPATHLYKPFEEYLCDEHANNCLSKAGLISLGDPKYKWKDESFYA